MLLCMSVAVLYAGSFLNSTFSTMVHSELPFRGLINLAFVNAVYKSEFILRAFSLFYSL